MEEAQKPIVSVATLQLQLGDHKLLFRPADDMTGKESALLTQMFLNSVFVQTGAVIDFGAYIVENELQRHFVAIEQQENA